MLKNKLIWALILIVIIWCFFVWTGSFWLYHYQFLPGDDGVLHLNNIDQIIDQGKIKTNYPAIFHILIAALALVSGAPKINLTIYLTLGILGVLLPGILIIIFRKIDKLILIAPAIIGLVPIIGETYSHGQWPEIMAGMLVIFLAYLILKEKKLLSLFLGMAILFTHHLTAIAALGSLMIVYFIWLKRKKLLVLIGVVIFGLLMVLPSYFRLVYGYFKKFLIFDREYSLPLNNLTGLWRTDNLFYIILLLGIIAGIYFYLKKDKQKIFYLFIVAWFLLLMFFSRFSYGNDFISYRLMRNSLWPGLLILPLGWLLIIKKFYGLKKILLSSGFMLISVILLINTVYLEYPAQAYNRVTPEDNEILEFLKKDNVKQEKILMPAKNSLWHNYLSGQEFITTERGLAEQNEKDLLYWQILQGQINDPQIIEQENIGYVYQISPLNFYEIPYQAFWFSEEELLETGLWEVAKQNNRAKLFKLRK